MCLFGALRLWKMVAELHQTACLKHVILASWGMLTASRETVHIPICFPTLTAKPCLHLTTFNVACPNILEMHSICTCAWHCLQLPTLCTCLFTFLSAASGREREKESDGSQCLVCSQWLGCLWGDGQNHSFPGSAAWFKWPKGGFMNNSQLF